MPASRSSAGATESQPLRPTTMPPPGAVPSSSTMRPSRMRTLRSAPAAAAGSWETTITVAPSDLASCAMRLSTAWPLAASSSPVGSSASSSAGRWAMARHSAARWRSPPESTPGSSRTRSPSPTASSSCCARRRRAVRPAPRSASGRATPSRSGRSGESVEPECWPSRPSDRCRIRARARAGARPMSRPRTRTAPAEGVCSPAMIRSRVVLPAPLGPRTHTLSPGVTVSVAPCSAAASPSLVRCTLKTSRSSTTSVMAALRGCRRRYRARWPARARPGQRRSRRSAAPRDRPLPGAAPRRPARPPREWCSPPAGPARRR